jgi:hypothetical protein
VSASMVKYTKQNYFNTIPIQSHFHFYFEFCIWKQSINIKMVWKDTWSIPIYWVVNSWMGTFDTKYLMNYTYIRLGYKIILFLEGSKKNLVYFHLFTSYLSCILQKFTLRKEKLQKLFVFFKTYFQFNFMMQNFKLMHSSEELSCF